MKEGHGVNLEKSHGDSKAGSFHTAAFGENARDCQSELHPVWKVKPNLRRKSHNLVQGQVAKGQVATIQGQAATGDPDLVEIQQKTSSTT